MEYMPGGNLLDWLNRRKAEKGSEPIPELKRIFRQIAQAIEYCHNRGVIHRDLKLENVLMSGDDIPKLTDFGVAHDETQSTTTTYLGCSCGARKLRQYSPRFSCGIYCKSFQMKLV